MKRVIKIIILSSFILFLCFSTVEAQSQLAEKDQQVVDRYQTAKSNYLNTVNFYQKARANYIWAKRQYTSTKDEAVRDELVVKSKDFLIKILRSMINYLDTIKAKAENVPYLTDAERSSIISELDSDIAWLTQKQSEVEDITTGKQVVDKIKIIKEHWLDIRARAKKITGQLLAANINRIISKSKDFSQRVEDKISELKAQGYDTTDLENWLVDFDQKVALAESKYEKALEKFDAISSLGSINSLFKEGHNFLREANVYLRQAHADLKQIVLNLKQVAASQDSTSSED